MNYLDYYGFKFQPFGLTVDDRFYYESDQHSRALIKLRHVVDERRGLGLLVGEPGTGKTTLARKMLDSLEDDQFESAMLVVIHNAITSEWILKKMAVHLGVQAIPEEKTELSTALYNRLAEIYETGKKAVVLIDEAHMLQAKEVMDVFRGLLNIEIDGQSLISFLFFGATDLDTYLSKDKPLKQRVAVRLELKCLNEEATASYIMYRLKVAGGNREMFTQGALDTIYRCSEGIPRVINIICDNGFLEGFLQKKSKKQIDAEMIEQVASDLGFVT